MNPDPIVALISSWKEGRLIQGTIRSVLPYCAKVLVYDGATQQGETPGEKTDIGIYLGQVVVKEGFWKIEHEKRTEMLHQAKRLMQRKPFWILTIDADEILIWGEYLEDWLGVLRPGYPQTGENVVPIKRTEAAWTLNGGFVSDISPSRLIHSSMVAEYMVSCWKIKTPDGKIFDAGHYRAERMPMYGEPHIHHRSYLRRFERAQIRSSKGEEKEFLEKQGLDKLAKELPDLQNLERLLEDEHFRAD